MVLIQHIFKDYKGIQYKELLWIEGVVYIPRVIAWILSLANLLRGGLCVYGDAAGLTISIEGKRNIPFMHCMSRSGHRVVRSFGRMRRAERAVDCEGRC
jgi:hypothetical protein